MNKTTNTQHSISASLLRAALITAILLAGSASIALADEPHFGEAQVLAKVPAPGFPEGIVRNGPLTYVTGPATFGTAGNGLKSAIWVYNTTTGDLIFTRDVEGEDLAKDHANSCVAVDRFGRLYVLNLQLGIIRFDPLLITQQQYSRPFPDLKPCKEVETGATCSPTPVDLPPLPNDIAFDRFGNAYVTDSLQATIWIVPAGGGEPQVWFQDSKLSPSVNVPGSVGVNGIRINPQHNKVFVTVTIGPDGQGAIYTLPLGVHPTFGPMKLFHSFGPGDLPDGIAFGESGLLYVASATPFNSGIIALNSDGSEAFRFTNPPESPINPYDSPANIAFDGRGSLIVTNHAFATGGANPEQFQVLKVYVNDRGAELFKPIILQ
jgi:sugar lactone lactonase YvrE